MYGIFVFRIDDHNERSVGISTVSRHSGSLRSRLEDFGYQGAKIGIESSPMHY